MWLRDARHGGHPDAVCGARQAGHVDGDGAVRVVFGAEVEVEALVQRHDRHDGLQHRELVPACVMRVRRRERMATSH